MLVCCTSRLHLASLVRKELEKFSIETDSVLVGKRSFFVRRFVLEEDGEAWESIEALGAKVRLLGTSHHGVRHIVHSRRHLLILP